MSTGKKRTGPGKAGPVFPANEPKAKGVKPSRGLDSPPHFVPEPSLEFVVLRGMTRFVLLPEKKAPQPVPRGVMKN
jgi:hypothetical protein